MSAHVRVRGWLLVAAMVVASPAAGQQTASVQAAQNFRFSAAEVEAVVRARNSIARAVATTPGLGDQIISASQGDPTLDQVIARLRAIPQVKKAYNNAGLTTRQGVLSELALLLTAKAYQNSQQNPGAPPITPAMAANLALYQQYTGQLMAWQSEITGQGPVVDPDVVGVAGAYPDNLQLQNNLDVQQPGNVDVSQDPDIKPPGNVNVATDPDMRPAGNVNVATDPDMVQPGNESPSDPDMVNPISTDPDNVAP